MFSWFLWAPCDTDFIYPSFKYWFFNSFFFTDTELITKKKIHVEKDYKYFKTSVCYVTEIQGNVNFERVFIYPVSTLTDHGTICSDSGSSGGEYQMLIKEGNAKILHSNICDLYHTVGYWIDGEFHFNKMNNG